MQLMSSDLSYKGIILRLVDPVPETVEGGTFQIHRIVGSCAVMLYPVTTHNDDRCPFILAGERCGRKLGHDGKHCWANGD